MQVLTLLMHYFFSLSGGNFYFKLQDHRNILYYFNIKYFRRDLKREFVWKNGFDTPDRKNAEEKKKNWQL